MGYAQAISWKVSIDGEGTMHALFVCRLVHGLDGTAHL